MSSHRPYSGSLKAVIFDWAGTTVDYGCFAPVAVFIEVFKRRGVTINIAQARAPMGLEKRDHIRAIVQQPEIAAEWQHIYGQPCTELDIDAMYADSVTVQVECVADFADLIPGTLDTMNECRARGLKIGTTTGYSRAVMDILMPTAAQRGYTPDAVICPTDVPTGRPAPWMIYQNAMQLGVYPMAAVVKVGDTLPDIEEGLNAGVWTVAVSLTGNELGLSAAEANTMSLSERKQRLGAIETRLWQAGAHFVIHSIADLPAVLDDIQQRLHLGENP